MKCSSTKRLLVMAGLIWALFLVGHLAGLRHSTGALSGTMPATEAELIWGMLYVLSWFGSVLVAPIFAIAAGLRFAAEALLRSARARRAAQRALKGPILAAEERLSRAAG